jgi:hypothetical protein
LFRRCLRFAFVAIKTADRSKALLNCEDALRVRWRFRHHPLEEALPFGADAQDIQLAFSRRSREIYLEGRGGFADQLQRKFPNVGGVVRRHSSETR